MELEVSKREELSTRAMLQPAQVWANETILVRLGSLHGIASMGRTILVDQGISNGSREREGPFHAEDVSRLLRKLGGIRKAIEVLVPECRSSRRCIPKASGDLYLAVHVRHALEARMHSKVHDVIIPEFLRICGKGHLVDADCAGVLKNLADAAGPDFSKHLSCAGRRLISLCE